jgi:hypothetical protein
MKRLANSEGGGKTDCHAATYFIRGTLGEMPRLFEELK